MVSRPDQRRAIKGVVNPFSIIILVKLFLPGFFYARIFVYIYTIKIKYMNYLLTLTQKNSVVPMDRIVIPNTSEEMIIKGINTMVNQEPDHYELYAKNIKIYTDMGDGPEGEYLDGSSWQEWEWSARPIEILV